MKLIEVNRELIINAENINHIKISKSGEVSIFMNGRYSFEPIKISWLEWRDLKVKLSLYDVTIDGSVCVEEKEHG